MRSKAITTPAVVITLGTTSSLAALELCRHLATLEQDDRNSVAMLTIDTDISRPHMKDFLDGHRGMFQVFNTLIAVPPGINATDEPPHKNHTFIPTKTPQYFDFGAGGIRNNGHVALCYEHDRVEQSLRECLGAVHYLGFQEQEQRSASAQVYVVAFLGGGTGSGIVADLAVMMRNILTGDRKQQRLILFAILPGDNIPGVSNNRESWRKSNATAALLEIMAHGLAAKKTGIYQKYLMGQSYNVPDAPLFNEIYLVGRTNLNSVEGTARIVGLDLFHRITDASGIGDKERSEGPDRKELMDTDNGGLPTNFSTSCPFETRFPADEAAQAFAEVAAATMLELPNFIGHRPSRPIPGEKERGIWWQKWDQVAKAAPIAQITSDGVLIHQPRQYTGADFEQAPKTQRDVLWQRVERDMREMNDEIVRVVGLMRKQEMQRIERIPSSVSTANLPGLSVQARKILALETLQSEYQEALDRVTANPPRNPAQGRPSDLEGKLDHASFFPTFIVDYLNQGRAENVAQYYNGNLRANYQYTRYQQLTKLLNDLMQRTKDLLIEEEQWLNDTQAAEQAKKLRDQGYKRDVWRGQLALPHQHQRHLFDLALFHKQADENGLDFLPAMEGVFRLATTNNDGLELGDCTRRDTFDLKAVLTGLIGDCIKHISAASRNPDGGDSSQEQSNDQDLAAERARQLPEKVVEYFREQYQNRLKERNLFDLLAIGMAAEKGMTMPAARRKIDEPLQAHLTHIKGILSELVTFEPGLWLNGTKKLEPTLYLGMAWSVGKENQEKMLDQALGSIGELTRRTLAPKTCLEADPHRLQVNYAHHGISIRTIPDFYNATSSAMGDFSFHQDEWFGDGKSQAHGGSYGKSQAPVHNSGEMERLVWSTTALAYSSGQNLEQRVLRDQFHRDEGPDWYTDEQSGDPPRGGNNPGGNNPGGNNPGGNNPGGNYPNGGRYPRSENYPNRERAPGNYPRGNLDDGAL